MGGLLITVFASHAFADGPGTTAAGFLKIGVGARAAAMGDAFTVIVDDSTALYWNPAGLAKIEKRQLLATYNMWFAGINQGYLGVGFPLSGQGIVAGGVNYVDMGDFDGRDEAGNPTGTFTASALNYHLGYANRVGEKLMWGISAGLVQDTIASDTKSTYAANLGLIFKSSESLSLGLALQNIGGQLGGDPLPFVAKVGMAYSWKSLLLVLDIASPTDNDVYYGAGIEWWIMDGIALRAGYKTNQDIGEGLTAGLGFNKGKIRFDYAYVPYGELGNTHKVSLGMSF
jgi:opacity protein-like surface antigen